MDADSKTKAMALGLAGTGKADKGLYEHIDQRYRIMYGHTDYKAGSKDDPMGLALLGQPEPREVHPVRPGYEPAPVPPSHPGPDIEQHGMYDPHLDAMGGKKTPQRLL